MRLVWSQSDANRVIVDGSIEVCTPVVRQIRKEDGDTGGIVLRGPAASAVEIKNPKVVIRIDVTSAGVDANILGRLQAELGVATFDVYGTTATSTGVTRTNISPHLLWTCGHIGVDLRPYAVSQAKLVICNRALRPLVIRTRVEVYECD